MFSASLVGLLCWAALPDAPANSKDEYIAKLTAAHPNADAQFRLAIWAERQGMKDVADGHLRSAVHLDPNHAAAQKALGRILKDGRWETKAERAARLAREAELQSEIGDWRRLLNEGGLAKATANRPLTEAGIAAVEEFASNDEFRANAAVSAFRKSNLGAATLALCRQAIGSRYVKIRTLAIEALRERSVEHFLHLFVERLRPLPAGKSYILGAGEIWYWQEGTTTFVSLPVAPPTGGLLRSPGARNAPATNDGESRNANAEETRAHAVEALMALTGEDFGDDFPKWRQAVMQITGRHIDARAPEATSVVATYYQPDALVVGTATGGAQPFSCFAAGTLIATKRGEVPIDKVCIGELVLSRNVETGETGYKPVLTRTLRQRVPMNKLSVGGESLVVTPGHPIWSPNGGWTKATSLSRNAAVAAEDKTLGVTGNEPAEPAQAYNLVVADFGTYFVGKSRVLVHDNTPIRESK